MRRAAVGLGLTAAVACTSEPGLPTNVDEEDFVSFVAVETCRDAFDCSCPELPWESASECRDQQSQRRVDEQTIARANGLTYDGQCVVEIILRARELECEFRLDEAATPQQLEAAACRVPCKPYYGDKPEGEACSRFGLTVAVDDCAQGLQCSQDRVCERICTTRDPLMQGQACEVDGNVPCELTTFCDPGSLTCELPPQLSEPCEERCAAGSWCDRAPQTPVCVATLVTGEPCVLDESCVSGQCTDDVCAPPSAFVCPQ